jgi:hypothetical protein
VLTSRGIGPQAPVDPAMRGFVRIPNTGAALQRQAARRLHLRHRQRGRRQRFITAKIGERRSEQGRRPVFNANGKISAGRRRARAGRGRSPASTRTTSTAPGRASSASHPAPLQEHLQPTMVRPSVLRGPRRLAGHGGLRRSEPMIFARFPLVRCSPGSAWALNAD